MLDAVDWRKFPGGSREGGAGSGLGAERSKAMLDGLYGDQLYRIRVGEPENGGSA